MTGFSWLLYNSTKLNKFAISFMFSRDESQFSDILRDGHYGREGRVRRWWKGNRQGLGAETEVQEIPYRGKRDEFEST